MNYYKHPTAIVESDQIGEGTKIWAFTKVMSNARIGKNCNIGSFVEIAPNVIIGNDCKIQNGVSVYKGVTLEDKVFIAPYVTFTNVKNPRAFIESKDKYTNILVKLGATIGANATILGDPEVQRTIGEYAFVGAGSVVTHDVPDYALMVGNPARLVGWVCKCGKVMTKHLFSSPSDRIDPTQLSHVVKCEDCGVYEHGKGYFLPI